MTIRTAVCLAGATSLLTLGAIAPAHAGQNFTIQVDDTSVTVEQTFTVTGTVQNCANSPVSVTFSYTNLDDEPATVVEETTTDGEGSFSQDITVPTDALPDDAQESDEPTPPSVQATAQCGGETAQPTTQPPATDFAVAKAAQTAITSNSVTMSIVFATGVLSTNKPSGMAGTVVHVSGTNCLGEEVFAALTNGDEFDEVDVTLNGGANTFAGDYTVPNFPPGNYTFVAVCNGTEFNEVAFTLLATPGGPSPTPLPSSSTTPPIVSGNVNFTG
jgi:hypothetical protein